MPEVSRREFLHQTTATLGAAATAGVPLLATGGARAESAGDPATRLPRLKVAPDLVVRQAAGLRPFRPSGFVVKAEPFGDKTLIHNYGHGGCGITLSWGTADMAAKLALATPHRKAAVIGCGVIGLTTARLLQDRGFEVAIHAADLPPHTTSDVAAGAFGVTDLVDDAHQSDEIGRSVAEAVRFSYRFFQGLGARYGVRPMDMYMLGAQPIEAPWDFAITPELFPFEILGPGEHPFPSAYASHFKTLIAETNTLMPALLEDVRTHGGTIEVRSFADKEQLQALDAPVVINATGIGAKALFGDPELVPTKGQLTVLKPQAEITYGYLDPVLDLYMFSRSDGIVLGGSHEDGVWSTDVDPRRAAQIVDGHGLVAGGMRG
ncbi:MAG: FAD-dependent oxidoreductase [Methyloceanibacter sp.]